MGSRGNLIRFAVLARPTNRRTTSPNLRRQFVTEGTDEIARRRQERFAEVVRALEAKGLGMSRIKAIGERIKSRTGWNGPWYTALNQAQDDQERKEIERAVAEWADGDAIAAHIAYGNDIFCSSDRGQSAGGSSIFDADNRAWLEKTYGIRILSLKALAAEICGH
jgi:hypothetical protein